MIQVLESLYQLLPPVLHVANSTDEEDNVLRLVRWKGGHLFDLLMSIMWLPHVLHGYLQVGASDTPERCLLTERRTWQLCIDVCIDYCIQHPSGCSSLKLTITLSRES